MTDILDLEGWSVIAKRLDEAEQITEADVEKIKRYVRGIAHCLPTMTPHMASARIYSRIKSPLRISCIDDLPVPYLDRTMQYLERLCSVARDHNRRMKAIDDEWLSRMTEGGEVAA